MMPGTRGNDIRISTSLTMFFLGGFRRSSRKSHVLSLVINVVMFIIIIYLLNINLVLKKNIAKLTQSKVNETQNIQPHSNKIRTSLREFVQSNLTVILFNEMGGHGESIFNNQLANLKKTFPSSQLLWNKGKQGLGKSLNLLISQVKTEYFLFLESRAWLSDRPQESITFLWNALEEFPQLDFVGGAYLSQGRLYVPCHRFRLCRWTFSESYEYEKSLDNLMICEGISSSFMGRTNSVKKVKGGFDENIPDVLVVKDFFLQAKSNNVVVATRPNVYFLTNQFRSLHNLWISGNITNELVPFAVKYKVFLFKDIEGNVIDICSPTSRLSGKDLCIEKNSHKLMLHGGHWAYTGIFTYPYLLKYLEITLGEVVKFFNQHNVSYHVYGGVSLGAIKMRSILPWEAGDIDIAVYEMTEDKLYNLLKPLAEQRGYVVRKRKSQVQVFCTPREVADVSGGLASIFHKKEKAPPRSEFIEIQTNGIWIRYKRDLVINLIQHYSKRYLEHKIYSSSETVECKINGHNACLPNFKTLLQGKAGTWREFFCEI